MRASLESRAVLRRACAAWVLAEVGGKRLAVPGKVRVLLREFALRGIALLGMWRYIMRVVGELSLAVETRTGWPWCRGCEVFIDGPR